MPHRANRLIVDEIVAQGWFRNPRTKGLPSDNWWLLEDTQRRTALLYIVRYSAESERGEPLELPNEPALPRIAELHREEGLTEVPFIALASVSDPGPDPEILSIQVWRIPNRYLSGVKRVPLASLGKPVFAC